MRAFCIFCAFDKLFSLHFLVKIKNVYYNGIITDFKEKEI